MVRMLVRAISGSPSGSRSPEIRASSGARPVLPNRSETTASRMIPAAWRSFYGRWASRVRSRMTSMRQLRVRDPQLPHGRMQGERVPNRAGYDHLAGPLDRVGTTYTAVGQPCRQTGPVATADRGRGLVARQQGQCAFLNGVVEGPRQGGEDPRGCYGPADLSGQAEGLAERGQDRIADSSFPTFFDQDVAPVSIDHRRPVTAFARADVGADLGMLLARLPLLGSDSMPSGLRNTPLSSP